MNPRALLVAALLLCAWSAPSRADAPWPNAIQSGTDWMKVSFVDENGQTRSDYWARRADIERAMYTAGAKRPAIPLYLLSPGKSVEVKNADYFTAKTGAYVMTHDGYTYNASRTGAPNFKTPASLVASLAEAIWKKKNPGVRYSYSPIPVVVAAPGAGDVESLPPTPMGAYDGHLGQALNLDDYYFKRPAKQPTSWWDSFWNNPDGAYKEELPRWSDYHKRVFPQELILAQIDNQNLGCYAYPESCAKDEYRKAGEQAQRGYTAPAIDLIVNARAKFASRAEVLAKPANASPTEFTADEIAVINTLNAMNGTRQAFTDGLAAARKDPKALAAFTANWRALVQKTFAAYLDKAKDAGRNEVDYAGMTAQLKDLTAQAAAGKFGGAAPSQPSTQPAKPGQTAPGGTPPPKDKPTKEHPKAAIALVDAEKKWLTKAQQDAYAADAKAPLAALAKARKDLAAAKKAKDQAKITAAKSAVAAANEKLDPILAKYRDLVRENLRPEDLDSYNKSLETLSKAKGSDAAKKVFSDGVAKYKMYADVLDGPNPTYEISLSQAEQNKLKALGDDKLAAYQKAIADNLTDPIARHKAVVAARALLSPTTPGTNPGTNPATTPPGTTPSADATPLDGAKKYYTDAEWKAFKDAYAAAKDDAAKKAAVNDALKVLASKPLSQDDFKNILATLADPAQHQVMCGQVGTGSAAAAGPASTNDTTLNAGKACQALGSATGTDAACTPKTPAGKPTDKKSGTAAVGGQVGVVKTKTDGATGPAKGGTLDLACANDPTLHPAPGPGTGPGTGGDQTATVPAPSGGDPASKPADKGIDPKVAANIRLSILGGITGIALGAFFGPVGMLVGAVAGAAVFYGLKQIKAP